MTARALLLGVVVAGVTACGDEASNLTHPNEGEPGASSSRRICPSCRARDVAGSETSDFSGSSDPCTGDPAPAPDDAQWNARLAEVRALYEGPFEASLRWAYVGLVEPESPTAFWTARPTGYEPVTTVSGSITLEPSQFFVGRPVSPDYAGPDCQDWFNVPLTVELATGDGALAGTARGWFRVGLGATRLIASIDLAQAQGTLDLHLDPSLEYGGGAELSFSFHPKGKRGEISIAVLPSEASNEREVGYWPLASDFPDDGCGQSGFPSTSDAPLAWFDGKTPEQVLATWNADLQSESIQGLRHDCAPGTMRETPVELSFELAAPDANGCELPAWPAGAVRGSFSHGGSFRMRTSDGQLDLPFVSVSATETDLAFWSDEALTVYSEDTSHLIPADQFGARSGIHGVHPGNSPALGYFASAFFSRMGGPISTSGSLSVQGLDCLSEEYCFVSVHTDVRWPMGDAAIPLCRL